MKKVFLIAVAMAAVILTSCSSESEFRGNEAKTQLSIKLSGVIKAQTRVVEAPGKTDAGTIQLQDGYIFAINPLGTVTYGEALNVSQALSSGQALGSLVASDSRIYIVCNIPTADQVTIAGLTTFDNIKTAISQMSTQTDYTKAALANANGQPISITVSGSTASVNVSVKPLISRLELVQVKGGANITGFNVTGVYVDSYFPAFTYVGGGSGTPYSQGISTTFAGIKDVGTWAASGTPLVADPQTLADGKVWAHNVASGGLPRFIIKLENVKYNPGSGEVDFSGTTHYLTVTSYTGVTTFERGKIYRVGGVNGITFTEEDLGLTPNPAAVDLTVEVDIQEWELVTPDANL